MLWSEKKKKIKTKRISRLHKIKMSMECEVCKALGIPNWWDGSALCFAHRDPLEKSIYCIGSKDRGGGMSNQAARICIVDKVKNRQYIKELFEEIRKCKVLCLNHHSMETIKNGEPGQCWGTNAARKPKLEEVKTGTHNTQTNLNQFF